MKQLFTPPSLDDELQDMLRRALRVVLQLSLAGSALGALVALAAGQTSAAIVIAAAAAGALAAAWLLRSGRLQASSFLLLTDMLAAATFLAWHGDGLNDVVLMLHPVIIIAGSLLIMDPRVFAVLVGLQIAALGLVAYGQRIGAVVSLKPDPGAVLADLGYAAIVLCLTGPGVYMLANVLRQRLAQARRDARALADSEARYRLIAENVRDIIWTTDMNLRFTYLSPSVEAASGYTLEEARDLSLPQFLTPDSLNRALAAFAEEAQHAGSEPAPGPPATLELEVVRKDGSTYWNDVRASFLRDERGEVTGLLGVTRDIDRRKHAEQVLRASEERLRLALDAAHMGTWDWDIVSQTVVWSKQVEPIFGLPPGGFDGTYQTYLGLILPEDLPAVQQAIDDALAGRTQTYEVEHRLRWPDGSLHWLQGVGQVYRDGAGRPVRMTGTVTDITERKQAQEEIDKLNVDLERRVNERTIQLQSAVQELESFSYTLSHNLRSPLRAITGFASILLEENRAQLDETAAGRLTRVRDNARLMGQMLDEFLRFIRLGRQPISRQNVSPGEIARQALEALKPEYAGQPAEIILGELPPCQADPALLGEVFRHLLDNALKFSRHQPAARIEIGSLTVQGETHYFVRDNGAGFDMRHADQLFGFFQRLHRVDEFEGIGVGLAFTQRILSRHGGHIWAEAEPGHGAAFYFTLPPEAPARR